MVVSRPTLRSSTLTRRLPLYTRLTALKELDPHIVKTVRTRSTLLTVVVKRMIIVVVWKICSILGDPLKLLYRRKWNVKRVIVKSANRVSTLRMDPKRAALYLNVMALIWKGPCILRILGRLVRASIKRRLSVTLKELRRWLDLFA